MAVKIRDVVAVAGLVKDIVGWTVRLIRGSRRANERVRGLPESDVQRQLEFAKRAGPPKS